jgi:hypothetical protein
MECGKCDKSHYGIIKPLEHLPPLLEIGKSKRLQS